MLYCAIFCILGTVLYDRGAFFHGGLETTQRQDTDRDFAGRDAGRGKASLDGDCGSLSTEFCRPSPSNADEAVELLPLPNIALGLARR